ncbi:MFS transporter, partial [Rhizobiaceae sp. 2RAB30]
MDLSDEAAPAGAVNDDLRPTKGQGSLDPAVPGKTLPLTRPVTLLFAVASGLAVANAYFAHPLLDVMADD